MKVAIGKLKDPNNFIQSIRVDKKGITIKIVMLSGKSGGHFVTVAPSLNVSGYGSSMKEADESFDANMEVFLDDLFALSKDEREREILKLGFRKEVFKNKNFSKSYVDENGILKNFEAGTLRKTMLEKASF